MTEDDKSPEDVTLQMLAAIAPLGRLQEILWVMAKLNEEPCRDGAEMKTIIEGAEKAAELAVQLYGAEALEFVRGLERKLDNAFSRQVSRAVGRILGRKDEPPEAPPAEG